ncbi:hypothetical protein HDU86_006265 [Geranomyces michiganensis]|nr:hypothetical protein HDU86_006265 [Geranomyces michiganensis]
MARKRQYLTMFLLLLDSGWIMMKMALTSIDTTVSAGPRQSGHPSPPPAEDVKVATPLSPVEGKPAFKHSENVAIPRSSPSSLPLSPPSEHRSSSPIPHSGDAALALSAEGPCASVIEKIEDMTTLSETSFASRSPPSAAIPALSPSDHKSCGRMLSELCKHASAWPFKTPVDPVLVGAPDYFDVVKRPMDLSTVERKLATHRYSEVQDFADDIQLMLNNCFLYNPPTNTVHQLGKSLESYFSLQLNKAFPTITTYSLPRTDQPFPAVATPGATPAAGPRRASKRSVRAPKIFEPEDLTLKKPKTPGSASHRRNSTASSAAAHVRDAELAGSSDEEMDQQISTLATCLQTINQQLALLTDKKKVKRKRSSISAAALPVAAAAAAIATPTAKRRKSKSQQQVVRSPSPVPMLLEENNPANLEKQCEYCATSETPMWRRGPSGCGTLCNKCGVKWRNGKIMGDNKLPETPVYAANTPGRTNKRKTFKKEAPMAAASAGRAAAKARGGGNAATGGGVLKKASATRTITYEQKNELSVLISNLDEYHMCGVVEIIRSGLPHLRDTQEEIELDINTIDGSTLCTLWDFVKKASRKMHYASAGPRGLASDEDESDDASSSDSD